MIGARWPRNAGAFDKFQRRRIAMELFFQEVFGHCARLLGAKAGPRFGLGNLMLKADDFAARGDVDEILLFLQRPEPAIGPAPQVEARAHQLTGTLQTDLAFEKRLGLVVEVEARRLVVIGETVALVAEEFFRLRPCAVAAHAKVDGGLGKCVVEIADGEPERAGQHRQADGDEAEVGGAEAFRHKVAVAEALDSAGLQEDSIGTIWERPTARLLRKGK